MTTTENSRADALTDEQRSAIGYAAMMLEHFADDRSTEVIRTLSEMLAASPVEQPTSPSNESHGASCQCPACNWERTHPEDEPTPSPADERAAFEAWFRKENAHLRLSEDDWQELFSLLEVDSAKAHIICGRAKSDWHVWQAARAASANETAAQGAMHLKGHASLAEMVSTHTSVWREAIAHMQTNKAYDSTYVEHELKALAHIEIACEVEIARSPAPSAEAWKCRTCNGRGMVGGPSYYAPDEGGEPCPDCAAPHPAQADARVGLTDEQRASITWAIRAAVERGYTADADVLRALLATPKPEPRAEVTGGDEPKARRLIRYGECRCILTQYCDGMCNPIYEDDARTGASS